MSKVLIDVKEVYKTAWKIQAAEEGLTLSAWVRAACAGRIAAAHESALAKIREHDIAVARSARTAALSAKIGGAVPEKKYKWLGKPCTREVWEAGQAQIAARSASLAELPALPASVQAEIDSIPDDNEPL